MISFKEWSKNQCLLSLGTCEKFRLLRTTLDLLIQNLHFNKIPRSTDLMYSPYSY